MKIVKEERQRAEVDFTNDLGLLYIDKLVVINVSVQRLGGGVCQELSTNFS